MKTNMTISKTLIVAFLAILLGNAPLLAADMEFYGGMYAEITTTINGSLWIYDATVAMYEPAHIQGFVVTTSGSVLDIYGGQIDYMLLVTTEENGLSDSQVTVYGTDFRVDGIPVDPATPELFLMGQTLSGLYENGTPFSFMVDCAVSGNATYLYYQTVKLGWVSSAPEIELEQAEYDFGQTEIGSMKQGTVTVYNTGDAGLTIQNVVLVQNGLGQFDFDPLQVVPVTLEPAGFLTLDIYFLPAVEGAAQAAIEIYSDDADEAVIEVVLLGEGIPMPALQQMNHIVDVFEWAVESGTLTGEGNAKSAANKVTSFGKMLGAAYELLATGYDEYALEALLAIEAKCDGQKSPRDFVEGDAVAELNALMNDLIDTLQNQ